MEPEKLRVLPDECANHEDREYVNLMAAIEMRAATCIEDAVAIMNDLRVHERNRVLTQLKEKLMEDLKE